MSDLWVDCWKKMFSMCSIAQNQCLRLHISEEKLGNVPGRLPSHRTIFIFFTWLPPPKKFPTAGFNLLVSKIRKVMNRFNELLKKCWQSPKKTHDEILMMFWIWEDLWLLFVPRSYTRIKGIKTPNQKLQKWIIKMSTVLKCIVLLLPMYSLYSYLDPGIIVERLLSGRVRSLF